MGKRLVTPYRLALLFLIPYFVVRVAYGSNNEFFQPNLGWIQMLIGLYAVTKIPNVGKISNSLGAYFLFFIFIILHFVIVNSLFDYYALAPDEIFRSFVIVFLYLSLSILYGYHFINTDPLEFSRAYYTLSAISIIFIFLSFALLHTTGIAILMNKYGGAGFRAHAFMTEPSGMAAPLAYFIGVSIRRKAWKTAAIGVFAVLMTDSAVVNFVVTIVAIFAAFSVIAYKRAFVAMLVLAAAFVTALFLGFDCETGSTFFVAGRKLACGFQSFQGIWDPDNSQLINYNNRLKTTIVAYELLFDSYIWVTGVGLNVSSTLIRVFYDDVENSLLISMFLQFGIFGGLSYLSLCVYGYRQARQFGSDFFLLYISILMSVNLNSAGGYYGYMLFFFMILALFLHNKYSIKRRADTLDARASPV